MNVIVKWIVNWLTMGPLKGHRTKILAGAVFVLTGLHAVGKLPLDQATYDSLLAILTAGGLLTAAEHKP